MKGRFSLQAASAGLLAALVGFASSPVIIAGLVGVGASQAQAASGLMALSIAMGVCGVALSLATKQPISIAWSTPGGALLATSGIVEGGFPAAVGAFLVTAGLVIVAGLWRPLGRWVAAIPVSIANAMLAGVLLGLCLAPVKAIAVHPVLALSIIVVWAVVFVLRRLYAVPVAVVLTVILTMATTDMSASSLGPLWPDPILVVPEFSLAATIGIALPLFIVTMASQNIPGIAVLKVNGYAPAPGRLFSITGAFSLIAAPFGGHAVNLAAITAALCAGEDAHPDPSRRYWAAVVAGATYVVLGLMAGAATALISVSPPILIEAVAGLALIGAFGSALMGSVSATRDREAAVLTFLVTASGLTFLGISGAFWGLVAGGAMLALTRFRSRSAPA